MYYRIIILCLLLFSCGVYKTQYYSHRVNNIYKTIDSLNISHSISIPLDLQELDNNVFVVNNNIQYIYHYKEMRKDTLFVFSATLYDNTWLVKFRKELNR